ncbi:hypothetical protein RYX36_009858 [Vicia faba]
MIPKEFKAKKKVIKEKYTKKRKIVLVSVIANKKIKLQKEEEKRVQINETSLDELHFKKPTPTFIDYNEVKKTLSDWKQQKVQRERETTRLKFEQIKNTADFYGNMDAMNDFYALIISSTKKKVIKEKSTKNRKIVFVSVIANKKIKLQEEEEEKRVKVNETSLDQLHFKKPAPTFIDYNEVKKILSDWKQQKIQR